MDSTDIPGPTLTSKWWLAKKKLVNNEMANWTQIVFIQRVMRGEESGPQQVGPVPSRVAVKEEKEPGAVTTWERFAPTSTYIHDTIHHSRMYVFLSCLAHWHWHWRPQRRKNIDSLRLRWALFLQFSNYIFNFYPNKTSGSFQTLRPSTIILLYDCLPRFYFYFHNSSYNF